MPTVPPCPPQALQLKTKQMRLPLCPDPVYPGLQGCRPARCWAQWLENSFPCEPAVQHAQVPPVPLPAKAEGPGVSPLDSPESACQSPPQPHALPQLWAMPGPGSLWKKQGQNTAMKGMFWLCFLSLSGSPLLLPFSPPCSFALDSVLASVDHSVPLALSPLHACTYACTHHLPNPAQSANPSQPGHRQS